MNDLDELLKEAPTLTFEPVVDTKPQLPAETVAPSGPQKSPSADFPA